jgi:hypothetical protein
VCLYTPTCTGAEEEHVTLRITRKKGSRSRATLVLEGKVAAEWAALLERECSDLLGSGLAVSPDHAAVTFDGTASRLNGNRMDRAFGLPINSRRNP